MGTGYFSEPATVAQSIVGLDLPVAEYLVTADITFPRYMPQADVDTLLRLEADACEPYLTAGMMTRVWRTYGEHDSNHGHLALWTASDMGVVEDAYASFPLVRRGYLVVQHITPLMVNPNDPGQPATELDGVPMTWHTLNGVLDVGIGAGDDTAMEHGVWIVPGQVSIHRHPESDNPRQIHFMVHTNGTAQKVAEIGPPTGEGERVIPGYIDFLAMWAGQPVRHQRWVERIRRDNGLVYGSYEDAKAALRSRHVVDGY